MESVNYLAVLVAAVVFFGIGSLWYTPILFGNVWLKEVGITPDEAAKGDMVKTMGLGFIAVLLMTLTLAMFLRDSGYSVVEGARWGAYAGIGFSGAIVLLNAAFEGKSWTYIAINAGYALVGLTISGAILRAWL